MKTTGTIVTTVLFFILMAGWGYACDSGDCDCTGDCNGNQGGCRGIYADPGSGTWVTVKIGTSFPDYTEIQRIPSLPKGKYVANAMANLYSQDWTQSRDVECYFELGGYFTGVRSFGVVPPNGMITLPLTTAFTIDEDQDLAVACWTNGEGMIWSQPSPITLIRVNNLKVYQGDGLVH